MRKIKNILSFATVVAIMAIGMLSCNSNKSSQPKQEEVTTIATDSSLATLEEIAKILNEPQPFFIATMENGEPRVRPFGFSMLHDGKIYFATSVEKAIYTQLLKNPKLELCSTTERNNFIRVRGEATIANDTAAKAKAFEVAPYLRALYSEPGNPAFVLFYIQHGTVSFNFMDGKAPELINF